MIKIENTEIFGWEAAIRGMRNPMNSWDLSDSGWTKDIFNEPNGPAIMKGEYGFFIGKNDHKLMMKLAKGGSVHAKYRRMLIVTCDITAPLYWWKEFDTYKIGTVANSCSTMHKIHARELTIDDFSHEHLEGYYLDCLRNTINMINVARENFLELKVKQDWYSMIQLLPTSYNQKRTIQMNYEVLVGMYRDRHNHKLDEWHTLCDWIENLPFSETITLKGVE